MTKKMTLETLGAQVEKGFALMERGFASIADEIADIKRDMATKDQGSVRP